MAAPVRFSRLLAGARPCQRNRDPYVVAVGVGDHEIPMTPWLIRRAANDLDALGSHIVEQLVEMPIDPELRLYGSGKQQIADPLLYQVDRHLISIQHRIH